MTTPDDVEPNAHADGKLRCAWCTADPLYIDYHDREWGVPLHDDRRLFEMLCLEGAQAGLSWLTILRKREAYRRAFDNFDAEAMARYGAAKRRRLMKDAGIVRNRLKIDAFITTHGRTSRSATAPAHSTPISGNSPTAACCDAGRWISSAIATATPLERGDEQGSEALRLSFRRFDHLLRIHASRGDRG